jgi:hypothetical protein
MIEWNEAKNDIPENVQPTVLKDQSIDKFCLQDFDPFSHLMGADVRVFGLDSPRPQRSLKSVQFARKAHEEAEN